jgi:hypothetical protein
MDMGGYIRLTSSKKKPKTKANRRPSAKSISPASFGVFTTIVYNTKKKTVKNKFNRFKYRGTNLSSLRRRKVTFNTLDIKVVYQSSRIKILVFIKSKAVIVRVLDVIISSPQSGDAPLVIIRRDHGRRV